MKYVVRKIASTFMLAPAIAGCTPNTFEWKEEVLLHDGRKIIADRKDVMGGWAESGQTGAAQKRMITFPSPDDPRKKYTHQISGSSNYLLLDFYQGVPWLIVSVGPFSNETKCPIGSYETFTLVNDAWRSVRYAGLPKSFKNPNMAVSYTPDMPDPRKNGKILTSTEVQRLIDGMKRVLAGASGTTWRLVEKDSDGFVTDCDFYRQKAVGETK